MTQFLKSDLFRKFSVGFGVGLALAVVTSPALAASVASVLNIA